MVALSGKHKFLLFSLLGSKGAITNLVFNIGKQSVASTVLMDPECKSPFDLQ